MKLDEFTTAYIDCMLWSTNDESDKSGGSPLDENYDIKDVDPDSLAKIIEDCKAFQKEHANDIEGGYVSFRGEAWSDTEMAGHDFWLTRNGHGAGFWDVDWKEEVAKRMSETSKKMGEVHPYVGDDKKIHLSS